VLRLISLLAVAINPCKSRGQSQAQTVEFTRDDCNYSQLYPEAGDFTQNRIAEQGLIFYKNNGLQTPGWRIGRIAQLDTPVVAP
jgi:hypothetical protein